MRDGLVRTRDGSMEVGLRSTLRTRDGSAEDEDKGWVSEYKGWVIGVGWVAKMGFVDKDDGWVGEVPSSYSA